MTNFTKFAAAASIAMILPAMGTAATEVDADGDGMLTFAVVQAVYPEMTVDQFNQVDANADGMLDDEEVQAARDAGMMPQT